MCGVKRNQGHKCGWRNKGIINTQCNTDGCRYGAAMCGRHKHNFSAEMKRWLKNVLTNTTHLGFHIKGPTGGGLISTSGIITATTSFRYENANSPMNISKSKREKLQRGEIAMDISDEELIPFFENDLKYLQEEISQMSEKFLMVM